MIRHLFKPIDNAPLIVFRIFLGFLLFAETFGAILTGWVRRVMVDTKFTFNFIGLEFLQPLPGSGMYYYFGLMSIFGFMVMLGYKYRYSLGAFTLMWAGVYFMQKESYNNHYYLLLLICIMMLFLPADKYASIDAKNNPEIKSLSMPKWCSIVLIFQISIVYIFAVVSKLYPGWLDGSFIKLLYERPDHPEFLRPIFYNYYFQIFIAYMGILFDLLIVPLLLWKPTRTIAFVAAIIFHLANAVILQIGIFPFFALAFTVFFYPPERIRQIFLKRKPSVVGTELPYYKNSPMLLYFFIPYFIIQIALPLRHHFIEGDVLWTEEGHRLSWRMMLRHREGYTTLRVVDKVTKENISHNFYDDMSDKQRAFASTRPDGIWQMAQRIKNEFAKDGKEVEIYATTFVGINGKMYKQLIDPKVDLATAKWNYFAHNEWVLLQDYTTEPPASNSSRSLFKRKNE